MPRHFGRHDLVVERAMELRAAADDLVDAAFKANDFMLMSDADAARKLSAALITVTRRMGKRGETLAATGDPHDTLFCGRAA